MSASAPIGYVREITERREAILATAPASARRRITGALRVWRPEKSHHITVNVATGERTVEVVKARAPRPAQVEPKRKASPPVNDAASAYLRGLPLVNNPRGPDASVSPAQIAHAVAKAWDIDVGWLFAPARKREYAYPRFAAMMLMREICKLSTTQIGKYYGGRDHTTAIAALLRAKKLIDDDPEYFARYHAALSALGGAK